ncbi:hypothetical protein PFFVO_00279, partial [Plasmodium falciparum Vietnam Oak-Knoll (FVO)]
MNQTNQMNQMNIQHQRNSVNAPNIYIQNFDQNCDIYYNNNGKSNGNLNVQQSDNAHNPLIYDISELYNREKNEEQKTIFRDEYSNRTIIKALINKITNTPMINNSVKNIEDTNSSYNTDENVYNVCSMDEYTTNKYISKNYNENDQVIVQGNNTVPENDNNEIYKKENLSIFQDSLKDNIVEYNAYHDSRHHKPIDEQVAHYINNYYTNNNNDPYNRNSTNNNGIAENNINVNSAFNQYKENKQYYDLLNTFTGNIMERKNIMMQNVDYNERINGNSINIQGSNNQQMNDQLVDNNN